MKKEDYKVIRSKRKTVALELNKIGEVIVRANYKTPNKFIKKFIENHRNWIEEKQKIVEERNKNIIEKKYNSGEKFLYLGRYYALKILDSEKGIIYFDNGFYMSKNVQNNGKTMFELLYKKMAKAYMTRRVGEIAEKYNFTYKSVRITKANTRWGSCSSKRTLNFAYRLIMAPPHIIDYVIVHELCHLKELNHSKRFWSLVEKIDPDYKSHRKWLNENGARLTL